MSGDVLPFCKTQHQRALEALPWFLMGTLEPDEEQLIERHLQGCADCRAQLDAERKLRTAYVGSELAPDPEPALSRLREQFLATPPAPWQARVADRLRHAMRRLPAWTTLALATQLGVIVAMGWALDRSDATVAGYHALSAGAPAGGTLGKAVVMFDPGTAQRRVQGILRASSVRIVDGPLASGAYVLELPAGSISATLARLRAEPAVTLIEPLQAQGTP